MSSYRRVCRCKVCGKIYPNIFPSVCKKCGATIGWHSSNTVDIRIFHTENIEYITAKRTLFGWKVKGE